MGEYLFASGIRSNDVHFPGTNYIYVFLPVYWVPDDTTNTLSPGAMQLLYVFKSTVIETISYFDLTFHSRKKFSCVIIVKNNMDYLKLNVIRPTDVLGSKTKRERWCKYAPTIVSLRQPGKYVIKTMTAMYNHQNMDNASHKKIQEIEYLESVKRLPNCIPHMTVP